ncbi:MAG: hypothetical protein QW767_03030, partial [Thermoprotei archaeon]
MGSPTDPASEQLRQLLKNGFLHVDDEALASVPGLTLGRDLNGSTYAQVADKCELAAYAVTHG